MRALLIAGSALLLAGFIALPEGARAMKERPHCQVCRRWTDVSPSEVTALYQSGKRQKKIDVCSVFCYCERLEDLKVEPTNVLVRNYSTMNETQPRLTTAKSAFFLYDCTGDDEKSHPPFVFAFAKKENAVAAQQELGGKLLSWNDVIAKLKQLTDDWEPSTPPSE